MKSSPHTDVTLLCGGKIYSPTHPDATALAVRDDVIAWIGSDDVGREQFPHARIYDLAGAFVAPGFVDSHVNILPTGLRYAGLDLSYAHSAQDCLDLISSYDAHDQEVIWAYGLDTSSWADPASLTVNSLDTAARGKPLYIACSDGDSAWASTSLRHQVDNLGDLPGFSSQGLLQQQAHHHLYCAALKLVSPQQRANAQQACLDQASVAGIVALHACSQPGSERVEDFKKLCSSSCGVEVIGYWAQHATTAQQAHELIEETSAYGLGGNLYIDGTVETHTAWLTNPYTDQPNNRGTSYLSEDEILTHLISCTQAGISASFHASGDAAITILVQAFQQVIDRYGIPAVARCGHRLEHGDLITMSQAQQLGQWGVICSMHPVGLSKLGTTEHIYTRCLGQQRASLIQPFAALALAGAPLAFCSDTPQNLFDPWENVYTAAHHHHPASSISVRSAFAAATRGGWRAGGINDGLTGTLTPGAPASYAIWQTGDLEVGVPNDAVQRWSINPQSRVPALPVLPPDGPRPRCLQTVHRGKILYG